MSQSLAERFSTKYEVDPVSGCWVWTACRSATGYGKIGNMGRTMAAHRVSYELYVSPVGDGMCVLHKCDNRPCVNPQHLFVGTKADNTQDMIQKGRAAHPRGDDAPSAKLDSSQVLRIRERCMCGESYVVLAREYGISKRSVCSIARGDVWKHLLLPSSSKPSDRRIKLTHEQVSDIRRRYASGEMGKTMAEELGVSRTTISRVARGRGWKHLPSANSFLTRGAP